VNGKTYVVKVIGGEAEIEESSRVEGDHTIVDRVVREYTITYGRYGRRNAAVGRAVARTNVPDGREKDAERLAAVVEALTGKKPSIRRKKNGQIVIECYEGHLEGFGRYAELADAIEKWLKGTNRSSTL
jgi:hypothetical protein